MTKNVQFNDDANSIFPILDITSIDGPYAGTSTAYYWTRLDTKYGKTRYLNYRKDNPKTSREIAENDVFSVRKLIIEDENIIKL